LYFLAVSGMQGYKTINTNFIYQLKIMTLIGKNANIEKMQRRDFQKNMSLVFELVQLKSPSQDVPCMEMYAPILEELFSLQSEDWELDETANKIEDVLEWAQSLYDMNRYTESLSLITQMVYTINYLYEREAWYSMYDDLNGLDYSEVYWEMMELFEKLLHEQSLPDAVIVPVKQTLTAIAEEEVLTNYTSWNIGALLDDPKYHRPHNNFDLARERLRKLRK